MEFSQIGDMIGVAALGAASIGTFFSGRQRALRRQYKQLRIDADALQDYIVESRTQRRIHNMKHHADGENAIAIPSLPESMKRIEEDDE